MSLSSEALSLLMRNWPQWMNWKETAPLWAKLPPYRVKTERTSLAARFLLSVVTSTMRPAPAGA